MPNSACSAAPPASDDFQSITDLIDLERLQKLQDAFAAANEVASTLTDINGIPITIPSNHSKVCDMIRATEIGLKKCIFSGKELGRKAREQQTPIHHQCFSVGFTDAAAPIIVNGRHIANWLIGQYHIGAVNESRIREYALEIGVPPDVMVEEFRKMPKLTMAEFEKKLAFLEVMAKELSLMGYQNLLQRQQNAELNRSRKQLEEYQIHLEQQVEQRTGALQEANRSLTREMAQKTKIQKRQNRLITAIESAVEGIVITSALGKIIYVNPAFEILTGFSSREAIGKNPKILKSGFHDEEFYRNLWQTISTGKVWAGRFTNKKKDGTLYYEESTISPVKDQDGKIINYVAVKKDISKELELEKQLRQAQKLESIGTLAAGLAHEINTPIQYVLSNTQFLKDVLNDFSTLHKGYAGLVSLVSAAGAFGEEVAALTWLEQEVDLEYLQVEAEKAVTQALEGISRIASIVSAMKEFAQPGSTHRQPEDLNRIIRNVVEITRPEWQNMAEMQLDLDDKLPLVPLIANRFKQVLLDMILNCVHALSQKYVDKQSQMGRITIATRTTDKHVELRLADTGTGIPDSVIDKIFDPFFTTKAVGQGRGQGLSVAHGVIVENHGGRIDVSSQEGQGTEFTLTLPLEF